MKKKILSIILCVALLSAVAVAAVGCNKNTDTNVGDFVYEINSVDDFKGLYERLGADYDKGVYNLNVDLDLRSENWTPIGVSPALAFTGKFNGNNHTVKYSVRKDVPEKTDVNSVAEDAYIGLFGCTSGATIKDLSVIADISIPVESNRLYIGALAGYMFGDTVVENMTVGGSIKTDIADLRVSTVDEFGGVDTEYYGYYMTEYVGGLAGYVIGSADISVVNSAVDIDAGKSTQSLVDKVRLREVAAGGVIGLLRTVNLSAEDNSSVTKIKTATYGGNLDVVAGSLNAGGVIGLGYRVEAEGLRVGQDKSLVVNSRDRLNVGGIAGMLDHSSVSRANVVAPGGQMQVKGVYGSGTESSFNIGGIIGYLANGSSLASAKADVNIDVVRSVNNYLGGAVGILHFSEVSGVIAAGTLTYGGDDIFTQELISYGSDGQHLSSNYPYIYSGGLLGKIYGSSKISDAVTSVGAYQGVAGEAMSGVDVIIVEDLYVDMRASEDITSAEIQAAIDAWVAASEYKDKSDVYCEEVGSEDEKADAKKSGRHKVRLTYRVSRDYVVEDCYYITDSRASVDGTGYANGLGIYDVGATQSASVSASVEALIPNF